MYKNTDCCRGWVFMIFFFFSMRSFRTRLKHNMGHIILRSPILSPTMFNSFLLFSLLTLKIAITIQPIGFILRKQWFVVAFYRLPRIVGYFRTYNMRLFREYLKILMWKNVICFQLSDIPTKIIIGYFPGLVRWQQ